jgi:hypothetical protein
VEGVRCFAVGRQKSTIARNIQARATALIMNPTFPKKMLNVAGLFGHGQEKHRLGYHKITIGI